MLLSATEPPVEPCRAREPLRPCDAVVRQHPHPEIDRASALSQGAGIEPVRFRSLRLPQSRLSAQAEPPSGRSPTGIERFSVRPRKPQRHSIASALAIFSLWAIVLGVIASGIARELEALRLPA